MNPNLPDDLQGRILQWLDGELEENEAKHLDAELLGNPEARALYLQLAALHSALEDRYASQASIQSTPLVPVERLLARQRQRMVKGSLLAAAAVLVVSAAIFWMITAPETPTALASFRLGPDSAFTLTHSGEDAPSSGNFLNEGSRLHLTRGTMEGVFESGVRCVIEAPCDLSVLTEDRVFVAEGVAWFEVPAPAAGFTVKTPRFTAVDLGTEFGVVARGGGEHELHVTKGSVEMRSSSTGEAGRKLVLKAGQARRVDAGGRWHQIPTEPSRFATALPEAVFIVNHSFEADENPGPDGLFADGERGDFGGELTGWISQSGEPRAVQVGWRDIEPSEVDPFPPRPDRPAQALSLISSASVLNRTDRPWSSLRVGDKLTLTISLGLRAGEPPLVWNGKTFFGLTDGNFSPTGIPMTSDTVTDSGLITENPASGNGGFVDISLEHIVSPADLQRPGHLGILIVGDSSNRGNAVHQSCFDNVRLRISPGPKPSAGE